MSTLLLAQAEAYPTTEPGALEMILGGVGLLVYLGIIAVMIIAMWKVFTKAGKPGWASIVPIYNIIVMLEIVGRPLWWVILFFIPLVNVVIAIIFAIDLAKSFGKGGGFAAGLILLTPIFYLILGFGSAKYQGPAAATAS